MVNKKFIYSMLGFFVATMAVAYPWHAVIFHDKYMAMGAYTREHPIMPLGMVAMLLHGSVLVYFYPLFYRHKGGGHPVLRGIQYSLLMGLMAYGVMILGPAAKSNIEPVLDFIVLGACFETIHMVLVGLVIGLIHGRKP